MKKLAPTGHYAETEVPSSFWMLFAVAGFALACMGGAAFTVLQDLAKMGGTFDQLLLLAIAMAVPCYLLIGAKLALVRKHIDFSGDVLKISFRIKEIALWSRSLPRSGIKEFRLENQIPTQNLAPRQHGDTQYYIRGHWRLVCTSFSGRHFILDKNTEKESLEPLLIELQHWLSLAAR